MAYLIILINLILACSSVLSYRIDVEPKCSPFEYEEKTLTKMIRIEHEMEIMTKKVDHNLKTLREELVEFDSMKLRLDEQLESSQKSIEVMKENQAVFKQKLLDEIQNRPSYAFSAMWIANADPSRNDALKFSRVRLNDNDVYNSDTGEFKTPVDGTYMFTANVCVYNTKYLNLQFLADATVIGSFIIGDKDDYSCTSSTAMSQLLKGQIVKLIVVDRYGSGDIVYNRDDGFLSSFSGMLIK